MESIDNMDILLEDISNISCGKFSPNETTPACLLLQSTQLCDADHWLLDDDQLHPSRWFAFDTLKASLSQLHALYPTSVWFPVNHCNLYFRTIANRNDWLSWRIEQKLVCPNNG